MYAKIKYWTHFLQSAESRPNSTSEFSADKTNTLSVERHLNLIYAHACIEDKSTDNNKWVNIPIEIVQFKKLKIPAQLTQ